MKEAITGSQKTKWYRTTLGITVLIILFFPVGLYLMWRYAAWKKWLKITLSSIYGFFVLICVIAALNPLPYITVDNLKNGRITTDNKSYEITGSISGITDNVTVTVNGEPAKRDGVKFSYTASLKDGDNTMTIKSSANDKSDEEKFTLYKTPEAELKARRDAEAKKQADEAAKKKAEADAAEKKKRDEQNKAKTETTQSAPKPQESKPVTKSTMDRLWDASDQVLKTRRGVEIKFNPTIGTAQLYYTPDSIWDEKRAVQTTYKNFVNWGLKVKDFDGVQAIDVYTKTEFTDSYGKSSTETAVRVLMDVPEFRNYNWPSLEGQAIDYQLERDGMLYLHPAIRKNVDLSQAKLFL